MAKYYGVICDRCNEVVYNPSTHYRLDLKCALNRCEYLGVDLCPKCNEAVRDFISVYKTAKEVMTKE